MSDLVHLAAYLLSLHAAGQEAARHAQYNRAIEAERSAISAALSGLIGEGEDLPPSAFTGAPRLLAWTVARRAGSRWGARYLLATLPRLDLPLPLWSALLRETETELNLAEAIKPKRGAVGRLLRATREERALDLVRPAIQGLTTGRVGTDTSDRLRAAADILDGQWSLAGES